jgi:hypothetical protein
MTEKPSENVRENVLTDDNLEKGNFTPSTDNNSTDDAVQSSKLNSDAFKSDESDGEINWAVTHRIAAFSLCLLYVGKPSAESQALHINIVQVHKSPSTSSVPHLVTL